MIHKFKQNNYNVVLDVNSGAIHLVDSVAYDLLDYVAPNSYFPEFKSLNLDKLRSKYKSSELESAYEDIKNLYEFGLLFSKEDEENFNKLNKSLKTAPVKSMCLNIAHDCNLKCKYCFASTGDFGTSRKLMSEKVAKKSIDFLIKNSGSRHNLEVDFFGGEPLINFEVIKDTVMYARGLEKKCNKNFRFTVTTNGLLLKDDVIDFINKEMSNVVLSMDGRKEINDFCRKTNSDKGSYDVIVPKFQKLVNNRKDKDYYIRGTFTKRNLDFSKDVMHLNDLGFEQISVEPVTCEKTSVFAIREKDLEKIKNEYENLTNLMINVRKNGKYFNFFHFMLDLDSGPCILKKLKGCSCGVEYVAVTPEGDIYPCHQFVGKDEWKMGNVLDDTFNLNLREVFINANIYTKKDCKRCWARFYCSGGCNANNFNENKDILKPHKIMCELQKKRLECAVILKLEELNA